MSFSLLVLFLLDIMNQKARLAWELYLKMGTSSDSFSLLQLIANDCYKVLVRPFAFASAGRRLHVFVQKCSHIQL